MTATTPTLAERFTCDAKTRMLDRTGVGVPYCRRSIALGSLTDAQGIVRHFCQAPGHRGLVVRAYGEQPRAALERGVAIFSPPERWTCNQPGHVEGCAGNAGGDHELAGCHFCHRTQPIVDGTYRTYNFAGLGLKQVCDDCYEKGNEEPDEWVQEQDGYSLVIDGGD